MNKKADANFVVMTTLALLILVLASYWIYKTQKTSGTIISPELRRADDQKCKFDTQRDQELGKKIIDTDNDQRADYCDICTNGNNNEDSDGDYMPDNCDKASNDRTIAECSRTSTKDGRCTG